MLTFYVFYWKRLFAKKKMLAKNMLVESCCHVVLRSILMKNGELGKEMKVFKREKHRATQKTNDYFKL